jgi:hypothetical protein
MFLFCDRILSEFLLYACLIKHFNIKLYGKVELQFEALKMPALGGNACARAIFFFTGSVPVYTGEENLWAQSRPAFCGKQENICLFGKRIRIL